jgi:hypothetical protein
MEPALLPCIMGHFSKSLFLFGALLLVACGDDPGTLKAGNRYKTSGVGNNGSSTSDPSEPSSNGDSTNDTGSNGGTDTGSTGGGGGTANGGSGSGTGSANNNNSSGTPSTGASSAEQTCVDTINAYRKMVGSPALTRWTAEEKCSDGQAQSDSSTQAAHGAFGMCSENAQNECPGWPGPAQQMIPECLKAMWGEGPGGGHYENMKNARFTQVSCGFYTLADGSVWAVQNFR